MTRHGQLKQWCRDKSILGFGGTNFSNAPVWSLWWQYDDV